MTDKKEPDGLAGNGDIPSTPPAEGGVRMRRRRVYALLGDGGNPQTQVGAPKPVSVHLVPDVSDPLDATSSGDVLPENLWQIVDDADADTVRLFTRQAIAVAAVPPEDIRTFDLKSLHKYVIDLAAYCAAVYRATFGEGMPPVHLCLQHPRHVTVQVGKKKLSVQIRIKPFAHRIEVGYMLMERPPIGGGTFLPADNPPVCFSFPTDLANDTILVSGQDYQTWLPEALGLFARDVASVSDIMFKAKHRR